VLVLIRLLTGSLEPLQLPNNRLQAIGAKARLSLNSDVKQPTIS